MWVLFVELCGLRISFVICRQIARCQIGTLVSLGFLKITYETRCSGKSLSQILKYLRKDVQMHRQKLFVEIQKSKMRCMTSIFVQKDNLKYQFSTAILQTYFQVLMTLRSCKILHFFSYNPKQIITANIHTTQKPQESVGVFVHFFKAQMKSFNPFIQPSQSF